MTENSLRRAIMRVLRDKYEMSLSERKEYIDDLLPAYIGDYHRDTVGYAYRICRDYFGW